MTSADCLDPATILPDPQLLAGKQNALVPHSLADRDPSILKFHLPAEELFLKVDVWQIRRDLRAC